MVTRKRGKRKLKGGALFDKTRSYRVRNRKYPINLSEIAEVLKTVKDQLF